MKYLISKNDNCYIYIAVFFLSIQILGTVWKLYNLFIYYLVKMSIEFILGTVYNYPIIKRNSNTKAK